MSAAGNPHVAALLRKARRVLGSARRNLSEGDLETAISRAYFAAFHAASAAVLNEGEAPKSHKGTHNRFYVLFVQTGRVPDDLRHVLPSAYQLRQDAEYRYDVEFEREQAEVLIKEVQRFIGIIEPLIT